MNPSTREAELRQEEDCCKCEASLNCTVKVCHKKQNKTKTKQTNKTLPPRGTQCKAGKRRACTCRFSAQHLPWLLTALQTNPFERLTLPLSLGPALSLLLPSSRTLQPFCLRLSQHTGVGTSERSHWLYSAFPCFSHKLFHSPRHGLGVPSTRHPPVPLSPCVEVTQDTS